MSNATTTPLLRTGQALVTIRNPEGFHLTFRFRPRRPWVDAFGVPQPGDGWWLDCRGSGFEWVSVGIVSETGVLRATRTATDDRMIQYAARVVLSALARGETQHVVRDRRYQLLVEDRCGACGRELTDPVSIERGMGPECYGKATGAKRAKGQQA